MDRVPAPLRHSRAAQTVPKEVTRQKYSYSQRGPEHGRRKNIDQLRPPFSLNQHVLGRALRVSSTMQQEYLARAPIIAYRLEAVRDTVSSVIGQQPVGRGANSDTTRRGGHHWTRYDIYHLRLAYREFDRLLLDARASASTPKTRRQASSSTIAGNMVPFRRAIWLRYDMLRGTQRTLPNVPIVCTLHHNISVSRRRVQIVQVSSTAPCTKGLAAAFSANYFPRVPSATSSCVSDSSLALEVMDIFIAPTSTFAALRRVGDTAGGVPATRTPGLYPTVAPDPSDAAGVQRIGFFSDNDAGTRL